MDESRSIADRKAALRAEIRRRRGEVCAAMSPAELGARAEAITAAACAHELVRDAVAAGRGIAVYESSDSEPPTLALIERLRDTGSIVLVPRVQPHRRLAWVRIDEIGKPGALLAGGAGSAAERAGTIGAAGLRRHDCAVVITPALAVGRDGTRLGQGGGYFDRLIAETRTRVGAGRRAAQPAFLALVGPDEVVESVPTDALDQPIDGWIVG